MTAIIMHITATIVEYLNDTEYAALHAEWSKLWKYKHIENVTKCEKIL
jgi:hypothetical protein